MDDGSNFYKSMIMNVMKINNNYLGEGSRYIHLDEEPNINIIKFLKFSDELFIKLVYNTQ